MHLTVGMAHAVLDCRIPHDVNSTNHIQCILLSVMTTIHSKVFHQHTHTNTQTRLSLLLHIK